MPIDCSNGGDKFYVSNREYKWLRSCKLFPRSLIPDTRCSKCSGTEENRKPLVERKDLRGCSSCRNKMLQKMKNSTGPKKIVLIHNLCPGDVTVLTAALRDLHRANPGKFLTHICCPQPELFENNPYQSNFEFNNKLAQNCWKEDKPAEENDIFYYRWNYPLVHQSHKPGHFINTFADYLEEILLVKCSITEFKPDIYLSHKEKNWDNPYGKYWILGTHGKFDCTSKWWVPNYWNEVCDYLISKKLNVVQIGSSRDFGMPLPKAINLLGAKSWREAIKLIYHSQGIVCVENAYHHLAAALDKPCVVIAGSRVPRHFEAYPGQIYLSNEGTMSCSNRGCWKFRAQKLEDGHDGSSCDNLVSVDNWKDYPKFGSKVNIAACRVVITPSMVINGIESYYEGKRLQI
jgi:ADP-heptose:LPS heptosyltransferase